MYVATSEIPPPPPQPISSRCSPRRLAARLKPSRMATCLSLRNVAKDKRRRDIHNKGMYVKEIPRLVTLVDKPTQACRTSSQYSNNSQI